MAIHSLNILRYFMVLVCLNIASAILGQTAVMDSARIRTSLDQWLKIDADKRPSPETEGLDRMAHIAVQNEWEELSNRLCRELGTFYRDNGYPDAAIYWFSKYLDDVSSASDSLQIALALTHLGNTYMAQGDHPTALAYNTRALQIRLQHADKEQPVRIANSWMFAGVSLMRLNRLQEALTHYEASLHIRVTQTDSVGYSLLMGNMASLYFKMGDIAKGDQFYQYAIGFRKEGRQDRALGGYHLGLGEALWEVGSADKAIAHLETSAKHFGQARIPMKVGESYLLLGKIYAHQNNFERANQYLLEAVPLAQQRGTLLLPQRIYWELYQVAQSANRYKEALHYYQQYEIYQDSLLFLRNKRSLAQLQTEQELSQKNRSIAELSQKNTERTRQRNILLAGLALALVLISIVFAFSRVRRKAYLDMRMRKQEAEQLLQDKEKLLNALKETQQQLIQHEKMAALGQLTAGIAHQLNNPLNYIISNAEALKLDHIDLKKQLEQKIESTPEIRALEAEITQLIADIERGAQRMRDIVQELSVFSRTDQINPEAVQLQAILQESLEITQQRGARGWAIVQDWPEDLPTIQGHSGKLIQLFTNLLSNAFDALEMRYGTAYAQGRVHLSARLKQGVIIVSIADNGPGIAPDQLQRIFNPFYTSKPVGKGTGLGLSIAFAIAKAHRGSITARSSSGEGAVFEVELPLR